MSTFVEADVTCPACAVVYRMVLARGINIARTPQARDAILAREFQRSTCSTCGSQHTVVRPFTYVDWSRAQVFGVFPVSDRDRWAECEASMEGTFDRTLGEDSQGVPDDLPDVVVLRTVFGLEALREKLIVFDAGLDDTAVEALKLRWMLTNGTVEEPAPVVVDIPDGYLLIARQGSEVITFTRDDHDALLGDDEIFGPIAAHLEGRSYRDVERLLTPR